MKGVARDNNASTECRSNNLDHSVEVRRILRVCEKKEERKGNRKMDGFRWEGIETRKMKAGKYGARRLRNCRERRNFLERDLPEGIRFLGITGRNCFSAARDNHGYACTSSMTIYLGEIKGF